MVDSRLGGYGSNRGRRRTWIGICRLRDLSKRPAEVHRSAVARIQPACCGHHAYQADRSREGVLILRRGHQRRARCHRAVPSRKEIRLAIDLLVERRTIHDVLCVFDRSGRRRRRVFRMNRDQLVRDIDRSHREMNVPLLPAQGNCLIEHAELLRRMQLLDLVPGKRNVSERIAMKRDFAGCLAHELPMQRVAIAQNQHIGRGVGCWRGRLALARAQRKSRKARR